MPHYPSKKQKLEGHQITFDDLGVDLLATIYGFFPLQNIMPFRRINKKSREAVTRTIPPDDFCVDSVESYNVMGVMTTVLPNLEQITLYGLGRGHQWSDGEDPDEEWTAETPYWTSHDIGIISNFSKLRTLEIDCDSYLNSGSYSRFSTLVNNYCDAYLNGRYPALFNFSQLEKLSLKYCNYLKWDLGMLAGLPLLKELECSDNACLTGNVNNLRVLKDTIEKVKINDCDGIEGNFMDLAEFPHLKALDLEGTAVTGDIRDIGEKDFPNLERLKLPHGVYGGVGYEIQRISDAHDLVRAVYLLEKQRPTVLDDGWFGRLSMNSPDRYGIVDEDFDSPPFDITLIEAGSRFGYRWESDKGEPCEVNWLDLEPDRESDDYEEYIEESQWRERKVNIYRGFHQPPTEEEYRYIMV